MPELLDDLSMYKLLVYTAQLISQSRYARYFALKGGLVLTIRLFEAGRDDLFCRTVDIDVHCSSKDAWNAFCASCEQLLNANSDGIRYRLVKRRADIKGLDTSDSLTFEVTLPTGQVVPLKMDMNIKDSGIVELSFDCRLQMQTYSDLTSLSDKLVVVSSQKIYRRIKDLYDICVLISLSNFRMSEIRRMLLKKHNMKVSDLTFMLTPENMPALVHAYSCFSGIHNKPDFSTLISMANSFLIPIYQEAKTAELWRCDRCAWVRE